MAKKWRSKGYILIGGDPGAKAGLAWRPPGGDIESLSVNLLGLQGEFETIRDAFPDYRVVVFIEKVATRWKYAREHKATANAVADAVRKVWGRRQTVRFVDPQVWQRAVLSGIPGPDPKARSRILAKEIVGWEVIDHNEADAVCILTYGESVWKLEQAVGR